MPLRKYDAVSPKLRLFLGRLNRALLAGLLIAYLAACATAQPTETRTLMASDDAVVQLVPQEAPHGTPPNDHPVKFSAGDVQSMLAALQMEPSRGLFQRLAGTGDDGTHHPASAEQVFTASTLREISGSVAQALALAGPRQDVAIKVLQFRNYRPLKSVGFDFIGSSSLTTARLFHRDGRLHFIFGLAGADPLNVMAPSGRANPQGSYRNEVDALSLAPLGSSRRPAKIDQLLSPASGISYHAPARTDWIEVDPPTVLAARAPEPVSAPPTEPPAVAPTPQPATQPQPAAALPTRATAPSSPVSIDPELAGRLRELKTLYEQGLITKELYEKEAGALIEQYGSKARPR